MSAAGPGTHPLAELLFHGGHPFPPKVEQLILQIHAVNPRAWLELADAAEAWARIPEHACGRVVGYLDRVLAEMTPGRREH